MSHFCRYSCTHQARAEGPRAAIASAGSRARVSAQDRRRRGEVGRASMSWEGLKNWDTEPAGAPPPPPPKPLAKRVPANVGPPADGCADPGCRDPTCAPLQRRGDGPRAEDLSQDRVRLQNAMLGLAKDNKAEEIARLCEAGLAATYGNSIGQTALHIAGIWNSVEAGEVLLDHGAKIDAQNDLSGMTPLHMAATRDRLEFCAMLLARGADPGIQDDSGRIAADVCENTQLEQLLRLPKDSPDAIASAAA